MSNVIIGGFICEGATDTRFLSGIIKRTFENVAFLCKGEIEVFDIYHIQPNGDNFMEKVKNAANEAYKSGVMVLCIHCDADDISDKVALENKIKPSIDAVNGLNDDKLCNNLVPIVPIYMTEAWMLADYDLLLDELSSDESVKYRSRRPELFSNPKYEIEEIIRQTFSQFSARRRHIDIAQLYLPMGLKVDLEKLSAQPSYVKFKNHVKEAFRILNYLE